MLGINFHGIGGMGRILRYNTAKPLKFDVQPKTYNITDSNYKVKVSIFQRIFGGIIADIHCAMNAAGLKNNIRLSLKYGPFVATGFEHQPDTFGTKTANLAASQQKGRASDFEDNSKIGGKPVENGTKFKV